VFKLPLSEGSCLSYRKLAHKSLASHEAHVKDALHQSAVVHVDETGPQVKGKKNWVHVLCNEKLTFYGINGRRASKAHQALGILDRYGGLMVHDGWCTYRKYTGASHALCNAHHLRELMSCIERGEPWSEKMLDHLLEMDRLKLSGIDCRRYF
jgi:hypothetical protein